MGVFFAAPIENGIVHNKGTLEVLRRGGSSTSSCMVLPKQMRDGAKVILSRAAAAVSHGHLAHAHVLGQIPSDVESVNCGFRVLETENRRTVKNMGRGNIDSYHMQWLEAGCIF